MDKSKRFLLSQVKQALKLYSDVLSQIKNMQQEEHSIFLVGQGFHTKEQSLRKKIEEKLVVNGSVKIYYPETFFEQKTYLAHTDLLSLETELAESVDAIVMCVESAGSIAELGVFSSQYQLKSKLVVYIHDGYKRDRSFIVLGIRKHLIKNRSKVNWHSFDEFTKDDVTQLLKTIISMKQQIPVTNGLTNPLFVEKYILAHIYVFHMFSRGEIESVFDQLIEQVEPVNKGRAKTILTASLDSLIRQKIISYGGRVQLALSDKGRDKLEQEFGRSFIIDYLDNARFDMLNLQLRKYWA